MRIVRLYGKKSKVCGKHRTNIGAAAARVGQCCHCLGRVATGGGALPKLCDDCSNGMNKCRYCLAWGGPHLDLDAIKTPVFQFKRGRPRKGIGDADVSE